jgi:hypothetical protein
MKRFIFCDTFRRKELSFSAPLLSQGVLPCGVRTFLSGVLTEPERPPANEKKIRA